MSWASSKCEDYSLKAERNDAVQTKPLLCHGPVLGGLFGKKDESESSGSGSGSVDQTSLKGLVETGSMPSNGMTQPP